MQQVKQVFELVGIYILHKRNVTFIICIQIFLPRYSALQCAVSIFQVMKLHDLIYFLLVFGALSNGKPQNNNDISSKGECKVTEKATGDIKPCQFPFIYNNKTYYGCTTVDNGEEGDNGIAWLV